MTDLLVRRSGSRALGPYRLVRRGSRALGGGGLVSAGSGGGGAPAAVGGAALLTDEANGFAADFTYATDANRVAVKASSVVTEYGVDAFFANSGTSPKQVYDVAGTLVWSPHNMCLQSQTFDQTTPWNPTTAMTVTANAIAAPDGTMTADRLVETAASNNHQLIHSNVTYILGETYTISIYAKAGERNWLSLAKINEAPADWFDLTNGVVGTSANGGVITSAGGGWYRCSITFVSSGTGGPNLFIRTANGQVGVYAGDITKGLYVWGAQLNRGSTPLPYLPTTTAGRNGLALDYDPVTHAAKGLLCEPAATNLVVQNSQFTGVWTASSATISTNTIAAPDGALTADTYTVTANANSLVYSTNFLTAVAATYTHSVFVKAGTATWMVLELWNGSAQNGVRLWFNLQTGALGAANAFTTGTYSSSAVQALPNGWYRIQVTGVWPASNLFFAMRVVDGDGAYNTTAINGLTFHLWGAQSETGTVATSPIPTYAATATRATDNYQCTTASINHSATAGSWWIEHVQNITGAWRTLTYTTSVVSPIAVNISNGYNSYDGAVALQKSFANVAGTIYKIATAFQSGSRAITANGLAAVADASTCANFLSPGTNVHFGGVNTGATNNYISKIYYVPRRMTNTELQDKTV